VTKACVNGLQKDCTKTGDDHVVILSPRAIEVLERQLALLERLRSAGLIDHGFLFVQPSGRPMAVVRDASMRWRRTLRKLPIRYRRPYTARHTSVSWDLLLGRNPLRVAQQRGHSLLTMLRVYAHGRAALWKRMSARSGTQ
jgi:integrase